MTPLAVEIARVGDVLIQRTPTRLRLALGQYAISRLDRPVTLRTIEHEVRWLMSIRPSWDKSNVVHDEGE